MRRQEGEEERNAWEMESIYRQLIQLGVTPNYVGFEQMACAVRLAVERPTMMLMVSKWCYPEVAAQLGTTAQAVERNLRTVVRVAWTNNAAHLSELAGYPLKEKPKPAQFIALLAGRMLYAANAEGKTGASSA